MRKANRITRPFKLCSSLSLELQMIKERRQYTFSHNNVDVDYSHVFFKFVNVPRPNHGMKLEQLEEVTLNLLNVIRQVKEEHGGLTHVST